MSQPDSTIATCPRDHGPLEQLMEMYGLPTARGVGGPPKGLVQQSDDGRMLAVRVRRCPACGYTELFSLSDSQ